MATGATRDFTYDPAGSTTAELHTVSTVSDSWAYTYNGQNRLTSVSFNGVEQAGYLYNFAGQQVVRTVWQGGVAVKTILAHASLTRGWASMTAIPERGCASICGSTAWHCSNTIFGKHCFINSLTPYTNLNIFGGAHNPPVPPLQRT